MVAVTSMAFIFINFFASTALVSTFSQAVWVNSTAIVTKKKKKKNRHTNPVRRPGRECAGGVCGWDCLTLAGLFVLVLFRQLLFK